MGDLLPKGWLSMPLSKVVDINPKLDKKIFSDDIDVPFVAMPSVEAETGVIDVSETRKFGDVKKGYTAFQENDVLFAKITPCMENGKMAVVPKLRNNIGFGSTEFHVLRAPADVLPEYVYYFVSSKQFRVDAEHNMTGAVGQRRVPTSYLENIKIPLPDYNEQKRIVTKIEELFTELDKGVASLKTAREQLKVYRQSLLKHAFEGKLTAKWREDNQINSWCSKKLGDLIEYITSGSRGWAEYYSEVGDIFIRAQNLKKDYLDLEDIAFVSLPEKTEGKRTQVQLGDVLITITGANVTKTGRVVSDIGNAYVSQHVALCRPSEKIDSEFLYWFLVAEPAGRRQLNQYAYGAGKPGLNLDNIRSVEINLPIITEQRLIVDELKKVLSEEEKISFDIDTELQRAELFRQSILKKAFSGKLVSQEDVSALSNQIKSHAISDNVVPFPAALPNIAATDLHAGIIAMAYRLHEQTLDKLNHFGHVKAEKISHLVEAHLGLSLGRKPVKDAAGPNDYPRLKKVEHRARKANWFDVKQQTNGQYIFIPKTGFDHLLEKTQQALDDRLSDVENLLQLMLPMTMRQAEILATVYAAWNNLLLVGKTPSDEEIVTEARENWHQSKLNIARDKFFTALNWMRKKGVVPSGRGHLVIEKNGQKV